MTDEPSSRPRTKAEQTEVTRHKLITVARKLFSERGFAHTSTEDLVQIAGVTRGALYHHFKNKEDLLKAVMFVLLEELATQVRSSVAAIDDPWEQFLRVCHALMEAILDPVLRRIVYVDAPAFLEEWAWDDIESDPTTRLLYDMLQSLLGQGIIRSLPMGALLCQIGGALETSAQWIVQSKDPHAALHDCLITFDALVLGLKV